MRSIMLATAAAIAGNAAVPAAAQTIDYQDFSSTAGLQLNGVAQAQTVDGRSVLRLTQAQFNQAGSAFSTNRIALGPNASFSTRFTFNMNQTVNGGADGFVFVIQPNANNVGSLGGGIGYQGIGNSLGIEFDTWNNGGSLDDDDNHVGINLNGSVASVSRIASPVDLASGQDRTAWVDYNGATGILEVRLAASDVRPISALLTYTVNLADVIGAPDAFVGFTSGTGAASENHDIVNWTFANRFAPIGGAVPEPASWAMMIAGFGLAGSVLRRRSRQALAA